MKFRQEDLLRCPGIRCALQNDELSLLHVFGDLTGGVLDINKIGFHFFRQRRGNTYEDAVHFCKTTKIRCGREHSSSHEVSNPLGRYGFEVAFALIEEVDLLRIRIEPEDVKPLLAKPYHQGQASISQAYDPYDGSPSFNLLDDLFHSNSPEL